MKRLQILILIIVISFFITGCEDEKIELTIKQGASQPKPKPKDVKNDNDSIKPKIEEPVNANSLEPNKPVIDEYPLKDVVVPQEVREEIEKKLPTINSSDPNIATNLRLYIRSFKEVGQKVLIDIVSDKNNPNRIYASAIVGMYCEVNYVPYLRRLIARDEENDVVLFNLMKSLASNNTTPGAGPDYIMEVYNKTNSQKKKKLILSFFVDTHNVNVYPLLYEAVKDIDPVLRLEAITTLGLIDLYSTFTEDQNNEFFEVLNDVMINDELESIRNAAVIALITVQDKRASKYLADFVKNRNNNYMYRAKAIDGISRQVDDRYNDVIIEQLSDPNWKVRLQSVISISNLRDKRCIPILLDLYKNDKNYKVRIQSLTSVSFFKDKRVKKALIENIDNKNPDFAFPAILYVINQGDPTVIDLIVKRLNDEKLDIRAASFLSIFMVLLDQKSDKYLDLLKKSAETEPDEPLKEEKMLKIKYLEEFLKNELQTKENTENGNQTQESKDKEPNKAE